LRLYRLDYQGLWSNEAVSVLASRQPLGGMLEQVLRLETTPPLYFLLLHGWFQFFGVGDFQARSISAVFGILTVALTYLLGRHLFDRRTGLLAACLVTLSQLAVLYSQEVRCYAQFLCLSTCASYLFILALRKRSAWAWLGFVGVSVLMLYTHYYSVFAIGAMLVYAWLYRQRYPLPLSWLAAGAAAVLALLAPWVATGMLLQSEMGKSSMLHEQPEWFRVHWRTLFGALDQFNNGLWEGPSGPRIWWCVLAGGLLFTAPALVAIANTFTRSRLLDAKTSEPTFKEGVVFVALLWLLPFLLIIGASGALKIQYQVRYIFFCITPYYLLVACGLCRLESLLLRRVLITLVVAYSTLALRANYELPYKENYRDALDYLAENYQEEDLCLFRPYFVEPPIQWSVYHENGPELRIVGPDDIASGRTTGKRIWAVSPRLTMSDGEESNSLERQLDATHSRALEKRYFGVYVRLYIPKQGGALKTTPSAPAGS
jgi:uncharacterized membrane protein